MQWSVQKVCWFLYSLLPYEISHLPQRFDSLIRYEDVLMQALIGSDGVNADECNGS